MKTSARKMFGDVIADKCKDVWDLDDKGEINAVSALPNPIRNISVD